MVLKNSKDYLIHLLLMSKRLNNITKQYLMVLIQQKQWRLLRKAQIRQLSKKQAQETSVSSPQSFERAWQALDTTEDDNLKNTKKDLLDLAQAGQLSANEANASGVASSGLRQLLASKLNANNVAIASAADCTALAQIYSSSESTKQSFKSASSSFIF